VEGENNPDPLVVHNPVVEPPVTVPVTATVGLFAHTKTSGLKVTIGAFVKFNFKLSNVFGQLLKLPVEVKLSVILPANKSEGEGK
jgi:hypothetical protein